MSAAVRSFLTAGVALVGAGAVTAAGVVPSATQQAETRMVQRAVSLAAVGQSCSGYHVDGCDIWAPQTYTPITVNKTGSVFNVPANIVNALISIPRAYLDGLNDLSYGLEVTGSWWVYTPTNVLGFDPGDRLRSPPWSTWRYRSRRCPSRWARASPGGARRTCR